MKLKSYRQNMNVVEVEGLRILISYEIAVAVFNTAIQDFIQTDKKWSRTTTRHISEWKKDLVAQGYKVDNSTTLPQSSFDSILDRVAP